MCFGMEYAGSLFLMYNHIIAAIVGLVPKNWANYCEEAVLLLFPLSKIALTGRMNADAAWLERKLSSSAHNALLSVVTVATVLRVWPGLSSTDASVDWGSLLLLLLTNERFVA